MNKVLGLTMTLVVGILIFALTMKMSWVAIDKEYQDIVDSSTMELVDRVSVKGFISRRVMQGYMQRLSFKPVQLFINHENANRRIITRTDILKEVFETDQGIYKLEEGDYIYVEVVGTLYGHENVVISRHGRRIEHESYR